MSHSTGPRSNAVGCRIAWLALVGRISRSDRQIAETLLHAANRVGITEFAASVTAKQSERDAYLAQTLAFEAVQTLRDALSRGEPAITFRVSSMPARVGQQTERDRTIAYLTSAFAALALVLAAVGLYGLLSFFVTQRNHEIGVRMALGANPSEVLALIFKHDTALVVIGLACGLAAAPLAARSLQGLFFEVTTLDPVTFISVATLLLAVGAIAAVVPARRRHGSIRSSCCDPSSPRPSAGRNSSSPHSNWRRD